MDKQEKNIYLEKKTEKQLIPLTGKQKTNKKNRQN